VKVSSISVIRVLFFHEYMKSFDCRYHPLHGVCGDKFLEQSQTLVVTFPEYERFGIWR
jgi:hypothetical protein